MYEELKNDGHWDTLHWIGRPLRVLLPCVADLSAEARLRLAECPGYLRSLSWADLNISF